MNLCKECNSELINERFQVVCPNCGLIHKQDYIQNNSFFNTTYYRSNDLGIKKSREILKGKETTLKNYFVKNKKIMNKAKFYNLIKVNNWTCYNYEQQHLKKLYDFCQYFRLNIIIFIEIKDLYLKILKQIKNNYRRFRIKLLFCCCYYIIKKRNCLILLKDIISYANSFGYKINKKIVINFMYQNREFFKTFERNIDDLLLKMLNKICYNDNVKNRFNNKIIPFSLENYKKKLFYLTKYLYKIFKQKNSVSINNYNLLSCLILYSDKIIAENYIYIKILTKDILTNLFNLGIFVLQGVFCNTRFKNVLKTIPIKAIRSYL